MASLGATEGWSKQSPALWAHVSSFLGGNALAHVSRAANTGVTLYQKRLYTEIIHFYEQDGGESYIREYFGFSEEEPIVVRLSCIMRQIRASNPSFLGIGLMGVRILPAYENALKAERLAKWKEMKGGHAYLAKRVKLLMAPGNEFRRAFEKWQLDHPEVRRWPVKSRFDVVFVNGSEGFESEGSE